MHYQILLLTYIIAVVTCQPDCDSAEDAVLNNQPCYNAFLGISAALRDNTTVISSEDLNTFCQPGCRNPVNRAVKCDGDNDEFPEVIRFLCTTDGGVSCYDVFQSPRIMALRDTFVASGVCADEIPDGEMCSQDCQAAFQNFIVEGGCCIAETFQFASQFSEEDLDEILSQCPVDLSRGGTCTEIGGANGLRAFGGVLLFAVMFTLTAF